MLEELFNLQIKTPLTSPDRLKGNYILPLNLFRLEYHLQLVMISRVWQILLLPITHSKIVRKHFAFAIPTCPPLEATAGLVRINTVRVLSVLTLARCPTNGQLS